MDRPRPLPAGLDLLALHRLAPARYPLLLESVAGGNALSRWDLLFIASGEGIELGADGLTRGLDGVAMEGGFLRALDGAWRAAPAGAGPADLPFRGGWALYLSYELAGEVEPVLALPPPPTPLPIALALRCPGVIARDRESGECVAWAEPAHATLLHALEADIAGIGQLPALPAWQAPAGIEEDPPQRFLDGVARVHEYLRAGDVFQVNLSRTWRARFDTPPDPAAWYARLREVEAKLETGTGEREALLDELDELDRVTHRIAVPLSYAEELYALRNNIYAVRKRLLAQRSRLAEGATD